MVFKGIINDKEFDNVQDYNNEMNKLISAGESISASSSTQVIDEPEVNKKKKEFNPYEYLPFFNKDSNYYVDALIDEDDESNQKNFDFMGKMLAESYDGLVNSTENEEISVEDALDLLNRIQEIRNIIRNDSKDTTEAINKLTMTINKADENIKLLKKAEPVFNMLSNYYKDAFENLKNYLIK